ncbi:hypothetical protein BC832DRAFT_569211 [Gaertneriomyces semiglobifer]|nr:hypothetical protein BC832DRAFT_569211 [Gaertneriomyces semiglobifer]
MTKYIDLAQQHGYSSSAGPSDEGEPPTQQAAPPQTKTGTGVSVSTMSHTVFFSNRDAQKSIYDYAQENNVSMVLRLLESEGSPIERLDESGCSLLHYAAMVRTVFPIVQANTTMGTTNNLLGNMNSC